MVHPEDVPLILGDAGRAVTLTNDDAPNVTLVVPHPHDVLLAKLERWEENDRKHADFILAQIPLSEQAFERLLAAAPYRTGRILEPDRIQRFEVHAAELRARLPSGFGSYGSGQQGGA